MEVLELKEPSLSALLALIESQAGKYRHLFRGQGDAAWKLMPGLFRLDSLNIHAGSLEENYSQFEQRCIEIFFDEGISHLPPINRNYSNDRILAQHFGVPTRLLDWTQDPLVATFFAVEAWESDVDAAIFMILPDAVHRPEDVRSLNHNVIALTPPAIDRRIPAQKSVFTFHPYGPKDQPFVALDDRDNIRNCITTTDRKTKRGFTKIVISKSIKRLLFQTLLGLGIDRRNLFPGLDGIGSDLAARARTGQIW